MRFEPIVDGKLEKPGVPFFRPRVDDSPGIVIEDRFRYALNLLEKGYVGGDDLKERFTKIETGEAVEGVVQDHAGHRVLTPFLVYTEVRFAPVKFCTESWFGILEDVDFPGASLFSPFGANPFDGAVADGMSCLDEVVPDLLPVPSLFSGECQVLFKDAVDLLFDFRGDNDARSPDLPVAWKDLFLNSLFDGLNPFNILFYSVTGYLEFFRDSSD